VFMPVPRIPIECRFWKHVDKLTETGCWHWTAALVRGYGKTSVHIDGRKRQVFAHRVAWELTRGKIPDGLLALHRCDNPRCVNPDHLFLGTHKDNVADMHSKLRGQHGERHWKSKLSEDQVREIRRRFSSGEPKRGLARAFGMDKSTIKGIVERLLWRHVD